MDGLIDDDYREMIRWITFGHHYQFAGDASMEDISNVQITGCQGETRLDTGHSLASEFAEVLVESTGCLFEGVSSQDLIAALRSGNIKFDGVMLARTFGGKLVVRSRTDELEAKLLASRREVGAVKRKLLPMRVTITYLAEQHTALVAKIRNKSSGDGDE